MGLSVVGTMMAYQTLRLEEMVVAQGAAGAGGLPGAGPAAAAGRLPHLLHLGLRRDQAGALRPPRGRERDRRLLRRVLGHEVRHDVPRRVPRDRRLRRRHHRHLPRRLAPAGGQHRVAARLGHAALVRRHRRRGLPGEDDPDDVAAAGDPLAAAALPLRPGPEALLEDPAPGLAGEHLRHRRGHPHRPVAPAAGLDRPRHHRRHRRAGRHRRPAASARRQPRRHGGHGTAPRPGTRRSTWPTSSTIGRSTSGSGSTSPR